MPTSSLPNSKSQVIILALLFEHLTPTQAAARFGVSRQWIYQLFTRYKADGYQALEQELTSESMILPHSLNS